MEPIILRTKLFPPPALPHALPRRHLLEALDSPLPRKLTVLAAPAGYGKTTLAVRWLAHRPAAWLALDDEDNDPARWLTYVSLALQEADPALANRALSLLQGNADVAPRQIAPTLLNDVARRAEPIYLALDDYHLIHNQEIHDVLAFMLEHAPPTLHLLLTSRMELPFSIARYRVRRQAVALRARDLRFTNEEAAVFLNELMQLDLASAEIAALETRTEGWAAGLQLAALSLERRDAASRTRFIQAFTGSNRYLMDYLVDEILQQQSLPTRRFLTRTAILRRFNAPLCAAVAGDPDGGAERPAALLRRLERANLFLIPLDEAREWFRYHHLFADLLRHQLAQREPEQVPRLHRRAAEWFAAAGFVDDALYHALQIPDYDRAAALLSAHIEHMVVRGDIRAALRAIDQLPPETRARDLRLRFYHAWVLMFTGRHAAASAIVADLETLPNPDGWPLAAFQNVVRGFLATRTGAFADGIAYSQQGYDRLSALANRDQTTAIIRGAAAVNLAHTYVFANEPARALPLARDAATLNMEAGNALAGLAATAIAVQLTVDYGRLREAERLLKQGLAAAATWAGDLPGQATRPLAAAPLLLELGKVYLQWNQVNEAAPRLLEAAELYRLTGASNEPDGLDGLLRLHWARRDTAAMTQILDELHALLGHAPAEYTLRRLRAGLVTWQSRLLSMEATRAHHHGEVAAWAQANEKLATAPLQIMYEFEQLALIRAWLYLGETEKAAVLLSRLAQFAAETGRDGAGWRIELLSIVALAQDGRRDAAVARLQALLARTEAEGVIRLYVDEWGTPLADLLLRCRPTPYRNQVLGALQMTVPAPAAAAAPVQEQPLVEPLSSRELEVLALLAEGATNQQIAAALVIAYATAKKHVSNIIGKLGVSNRVAAVARARALRLIP